MSVSGMIEALKTPSPCPSPLGEGVSRGLRHKGGGNFKRPLSHRGEGQGEGGLPRFV